MPISQKKALSMADSWASWLNGYGAKKFYQHFIGSSQNAESECVQCGRKIYLDIAEGGGVPDWCTQDGDYGCFESPDTNEDGTGGHVAKKLHGRGRF